jgi:hypothetical protein
MSLQIEKKWIGEEAVDGEKVKILYGQALKGVSVGGNEVEIIKIDASGDAVVPQGVVASESFVNSEIASEAASRIAGDASTLSSAQSYTDAEVLEEKGLREAEDLLMFKKDGSRTMTGKMNMGSFKIEGLANGVESGEAINKGQLDALELHVEQQIASLETDLEGQISTVSTNLSTEQTARISADNALSSRLDSLEADEVSKSYVDSADLVLDGKISTEKGRIDAILLSAGANTDTFAEIVSLINSVDTENDQAFASYVLTNNAAVAQVASDLISKESSLISADQALDGRLDILEADPTTKLYVDTQVASEASSRVSGDASTLSSANSYADGIVSTEASARIAGDSSTLSSAESYTDAEVLIEKNRAVAAESMLGMRVTFLEGKTLEEDLMFEVGVNSVGVNSITLPKMATGIYKVCVGRLNVFKNVDYTVGTEMVMSNGIPSPKTKLTWIGELASGGNSPISSGDKIFISFLYNA